MTHWMIRNEPVLWTSYNFPFIIHFFTNHFKNPTSVGIRPLPFITHSAFKCALKLKLKINNTWLIMTTSKAIRRLLPSASSFSWTLLWNRSEVMNASICHILFGSKSTCSSLNVFTKPLFKFSGPNQGSRDSKKRDSKTSSLHNGGEFRLGGR